LHSGPDYPHMLACLEKSDKLEEIYAKQIQTPVDNMS